MASLIKYESEDQTDESYSPQSSNDTRSRKRGSALLSGSIDALSSSSLAEAVANSQIYSCINQNHDSEILLASKNSSDVQENVSSIPSLLDFSQNLSALTALSDTTVASNDQPSFFPSSFSPSYSSLENERRKRFAYMNTYPFSTDSLVSSTLSCSNIFKSESASTSFESATAASLPVKTEFSFEITSGIGDDNVEEQECNDDNDMNNTSLSENKSGTSLGKDSIKASRCKSLPASINSTSEKGEDESYEEESSSIVASTFGEEESTVDTTQSFTLSERTGVKGEENSTTGASASTSPRASTSSSQPGHSATLPITNIGRIMKRTLPVNAKVTKESKEMIQDSVTEFIQFITADASEHCSSERRKTINSDDVIWAMQQRGLTQYVEHLTKFLKRFRLRSSSAHSNKILQDSATQSNGLNGNAKPGLKSTSKANEKASFEMPKSTSNEIGQISAFSESLGQFGYTSRFVNSQHDANIRNQQMPKFFSPSQDMLPSATVSLPHQFQGTYQMQQDHQFQRAYQMQQALLSQQQAFSSLQESIPMRQPTLQMPSHSGSFRHPSPPPSPLHSSQVIPHHLSAMPVCRSSDSQQSAISFTTTPAGRISAANAIHHIRPYFRCPPGAASVNYLGESSEQHSNRANVLVTHPFGKGNGLTEFSEFSNNSNISNSQGSMGSKTIS